MPAKADFLVEILTEELPPKALSRLAKHFLQGVEERIKKAELPYKFAESYATPRRLAVFVKALSAEQQSTVVERKGPAVEAAYTTDGRPTPACEGFARSCGVTTDELVKIENKQGAWVGYKQKVQGKSVKELMPKIVQEALAALPVPKRMRWGASDIEFVRPVHAVVMLYGREVIDAEILGKRTGRLTKGHRFHSQGWISLPSTSRYVKALERRYVIADFERRKNMIRQQAETIVKDTLGKHAQVQISEDLLDEVTGLVEWPIAIGGSFDDEFLNVPQEALISAMQDHQRYFPVVDQHHTLMPHFVTISNIDTRNLQQVIAGNERVLRARLSDAAFFYEQDKKHTLASRVEGLKNIVYQAKLGTLHEKAVRLSALTAFLAEKMHVNMTEAKRAGLLAKADLLSELVGEFPELQGTAGSYYAVNDGEPEAVAVALREQYQPRFSGDTVPESKLGCALALAEKIDTLVGVFGINQQPTGDKDPFALRRAALGVIRILIEKHIDIDLREVLEFAIQCYDSKLSNIDVVEQVVDFIQERLKPWYSDQNVPHDVYMAVAALDSARIYDMHRRIQAVQRFKQLPDAESLSVANKRVSNILAKYDGHLPSHDIDQTLFETDVERELALALDMQRKDIMPLYQSARYVDVLTQLAALRKPVDEFFEKVMVMTEDKARRENRLLMLKKLRDLFLQVADIALLQ